MTTLKAKTALNKLIKGDTLYHSVFDERIEPVKMIDGKTVNPDTGAEWSFNDFNQFYKTKELGEKDIKPKQETASKDYQSMWDSKEKIAKDKKAKQDKENYDRKQNSIKKLKPVMNELNKALGKKGFEFVLHTNESHYPCPAIHMKKGSDGPFSPIHELCREIYISNYQSETDYIQSGSCNMHKYKSKDVQELIQKIMDKTIDQRVWSLVWTRNQVTIQIKIGA